MIAVPRSRMPVEALESVRLASERISPVRRPPVVPDVGPVPRRRVFGLGLTIRRDIGKSPIGIPLPIALNNGSTRPLY